MSKWIARPLWRLQVATRQNLTICSKLFIMCTVHLTVVASTVRVHHPHDPNLGYLLQLICRNLLIRCITMVSILNEYVFITKTFQCVQPTEIGRRTTCKWLFHQVSQLACTARMYVFQPRASKAIILRMSDHGRLDAQYNNVTTHTDYVPCGWIGAMYTRCTYVYT